ncbi:MAG: AAA family ATPase, partial [Campylobacterota bacterium]|nr:AAA family ATPase [Campylobacterota bacterium]
MNKKLPYGISDFKTIQEDNFYYIDKTQYIEKLEMMPRYLFFIRPRRFGKSLLLSMLAYYYDLKYKDRFQEVFKNTYISKHPTKEANSYHVLRFDFSAVDSENPRDSMNSYCNSRLNIFVKKYNIDLVFEDNFIS